MTTPEDHVLAARDPTLTDENDWEEFSLTDVKIYAGNRYANLFLATKDNPVRVTGVLEELEEDQEHLLLDDRYLSKRIHIDNVSHYAYGEHEDGEYGIWVAGNAGWFFISTVAPGYRQVYKELIDAIDLHYFLVDRHGRKVKSKSKKGLLPEELFEEYVRYTHGRCQDVEDAAEVFHNNRVFLLTQMLQDNKKNGLNSSPICEYLQQSFPLDFEMVQGLLHRKSGDHHINGDRSDVDGGISKIKTDQKQQADVCFETLVKAVETDLIPIRRLSIRGLGQLLFKRYQLSSLNEAEKILRARADLLLELMEGTQPGGLDLKKRSIYRELQAAKAKNDNKGLDEVSLSHLQERSSTPVDESGEDSEDEDDGEDPLIIHHRKSVLRPRHFSAKAAERFGKQGLNVAEDSDQDGNISDQPASYHVSTSPTMSSPLVSRPKGAPQPNGILAGSKRNASVMKEDSTVKGLSTTMTANGPDDTWQCESADCTHVVHKASTGRSQGLIHDHLLTHANDSRAKLDLVFAEQRFHLPVSHLAQRIQELGGISPPSASTSPVSKRVKI